VTANGQKGDEGEKQRPAREKGNERREKGKDVKKSRSYGEHGRYLSG